MGVVGVVWPLTGFWGPVLDSPHFGVSYLQITCGQDGLGGMGGPASLVNLSPAWLTSRLCFPSVATLQVLFVLFIY